MTWHPVNNIFWMVPKLFFHIRVVPEKRCSLSNDGKLFLAISQNMLNCLAESTCFLNNKMQRDNYFPKFSWLLSTSTFSKVRVNSDWSLEKSRTFPGLSRTVLGHFPVLPSARSWAKSAFGGVCFNYFEYIISANNKMPQFPGLSRMDLFFPGLSSTEKNHKKNSRTFQDFQGSYGPCNVFFILIKK